LYRCYDYDDCKANAYRGNGVWREWFKEVVDLEAEYYMHFDLSKNKDRIGFSLTHSVGEIKIQVDPWALDDRARKERVDISELDEEDKYESRPLIKVDAIGWVANDPERHKSLLKNREFHYDSVLRRLIYQLKDFGCNVVKVTTDQYQSHHFKQSLEDRGYETELISLDRTDEIPVQSKNAVVENRVEFPYDKLLTIEAKNLKYINGKKVDHAQKKSKDVWDGFAGSIFNCEVNYDGGGCFEVMTGGDEYDEYDEY
jgi:hypothetical protein